jgi:hypothetical protein
MNKNTKFISGVEKRSILIESHSKDLLNINHVSDHETKILKYQNLESILVCELGVIVTNINIDFLFIE